MEVKLNADVLHPEAFAAVRGDRNPRMQIEI